VSNVGKKLRLRTTISVFVIIPLILLGICFATIWPIFQFSVNPTTQIQASKNPWDVYSVLQIQLQNLTNQDEFSSIATTLYLSYNVMINSTRQPPQFSLMEELPGLALFSVPLKDYPSGSGTYFFQTNGKETYADYQEWSWTNDTATTFQWESASSFPVDTFESPPIFIWCSDSTLPIIELVAPSIPGYVVTLRPIGIASPEQVFNSESFFQRAFVGQSQNTYEFQIVIQRDTSSIFLYLLYFFSVFFLVYFVGGLSRLLIDDVEKRLGIIATLSISIIAFLWTFRQIAGTITYIEGILLLELFVLVILEIYDRTDHIDWQHFFKNIKSKLNKLTPKKSI
jgi:hypothetical protein